MSRQLTRQEITRNHDMGYQLEEICGKKAAHSDPMTRDELVMGSLWEYERKFSGLPQAKEVKVLLAQDGFALSKNKFYSLLNRYNGMRAQEIISQMETTRYG
jgi:hypothetical protein